MAAADRHDKNRVLSDNLTEEEEDDDPTTVGRLDHFIRRRTVVVVLCLRSCRAAEIKNNSFD